MSKAKIDAGIVILACRRYLDEREKRIEAKREKMIQDCMNFPRLWRRLFGKPAFLTREEAIEHLRSGDSFSPYNMLPIQGGYWAAMVEDLLNIATVANRSGDKSVMVDSDVGTLLKPHFDVVKEAEDGDWKDAAEFNFEQYQDASRQLFEVCEVLQKIGDLAHEKSTGPAVPDTLWEIRNMAYEALENKEVTA